MPDWPQQCESLDWHETFYGNEFLGACFRNPSKIKTDHRKLSHRQPLSSPELPQHQELERQEK
jgi:hypothetical protein